MFRSCCLHLGINTLHLDPVSVMINTGVAAGGLIGTYAGWCRLDCDPNHKQRHWMDAWIERLVNPLLEGGIGVVCGCILGGLLGGTYPYSILLIPLSLAAGVKEWIDRNPKIGDGNQDP